MKRRTIIIFSILAVVAGGFLLFRSCNRDSSGNEKEFVTREQWISMLAEGFGMETHQSNTPYYSDVPADHSLFHQVQASVEWGVLSIYSESRLNLEKRVTCREVASTAAIAAGFPFERDLPKQNKEFDVEASIEYAVQNGIVDKEKELSGFMTVEECERAIQTAKRLYLNQEKEEEILIKMNSRVVDLCNLPEGSIRIQKTNGGVEVISFLSADVAALTQSAEGSFITIFTPNGPVEVRENDVVIVNPTRQYPTGTAYKVHIIQQVGGNAAFTAEIPTLSDIYDEIQLHTTLNANFDHIIWEDSVSVSPVDVQDMASTEEYQILPLSIASDGEAIPNGKERTFEFKIKIGNGGEPAGKTSFSFGSGTGAELLKEAKFTYHGTLGIEDFQGTADSWTKDLDRIEEDPNGGFEITGTLTFRELQVLTDVSYHAPDLFPESVSLQLNFDAKASTELKGHLKKIRQKIGTLPVPTSVPGLMVSVDLYLVADLSGNIKMEASLSESAKVEWEGAKLKRVVESEMNLSRQTAVELELGGSLSGGLTVYEVIPIIDAGVDVSGKLTADATVSGRRAITKTNDITTRHYTISAGLGIKFYAPIVKLKVGSEGTLFREVFDTEMEFVISDREKGAHCWDLFKDEWVIWEKKIVLGPNGEMDSGEKTYTTRFGKVNQTDFPAFEFHYPSGWEITEETLNQNEEIVRLKNQRGVEIVYSHYIDDQYLRDAEVMDTIQLEKVSDSSFVFDLLSEDLLYYGGPVYNGYGAPIIAKFRIVKDTYVEDADVFPPVYRYVLEDDIYYAVILQPRFTDASGELYGYEDGNFDMSVFPANPNAREFEFKIPFRRNAVGFAAVSPDGQFTAEEEQEVIEILSSFRLQA